MATVAVASAGFFMIAVSATPACTSGPKLHAGVAFSVIMEALAAPNRCGERRIDPGVHGAPRNHREGLPEVTNGYKCDLDVVLADARGTIRQCGLT